ncbi:hypothetical protein B0H14DRAFT_2615351 [Mycena olivaceomarginata]|nr:hypothetical protein B0H14DRAFT_2615351 [Mycena olivaceomarginata]
MALHEKHCIGSPKPLPSPLLLGSVAKLPLCRMVKLLQAVTNLRPALRTTPNPLICSHMLLHTAAGKVAAHSEEGSADESDKEHKHHPLATPMWPVRASLPQWCACMCPDSLEWIEHRGGHYFPPCQGVEGARGTSAYEEFMNSSAVLPSINPTPATDRWMHRGPFYAVVSDEWRGVVTSSASLERMKLKHPQARTFKASPWSRFDELWNMDCTEYHNHEGESPMSPSMPESSAPSSPSKLTDSTTSRPPSPSPLSTVLPTKASLHEENAPCNTPKLTKDKLNFLASYRPAQGPQAVALSLVPPLHNGSHTASSNGAPAHSCMTACNIKVTLDAGRKVINTKDGPAILWPEQEEAGHTGDNVQYNWPRYYPDIARILRISG